MEEARKSRPVLDAADRAGEAPPNGGLAKAPVSALPAIGPITRGWLETAGLPRVEDLRAVGAVEAYRRLKFMQPRAVGLNALYALEAALRGCHWLHLPPGVKAALRQEAKAIDLALRRSATALRRERDDTKGNAW